MLYLYVGGHVFIIAIPANYSFIVKYVLTRQNFFIANNIS